MTAESLNRDGIRWSVSRASVPNVAGKQQQAVILRSRQIGLTTFAKSRQFDRRVTLS
jgi:hypothetical protein